MLEKALIGMGLRRQNHHAQEVLFRRFLMLICLVLKMTLKIAKGFYVSNLNIMAKQ